MKVLISKKTGRYYYYTGVGDYHCKEGFIKEDDLNSNTNKVFSNLNREFLIFEANSYDYSNKFKIGPQIITKKDLGYILARTGINKNSTIIEAGSGSGSATSFFANIVEKVKSFEIREDHIKIAKKNLEFMNLKNVDFFKGDIKEEINFEKENTYDLLFLDLPNSEEILEQNLNLVKKGGYIVCYIPSITQILEVSKVISVKEELYLEEISEIILRNWKVWDKIARPNHRKEIDHTAFLVFIRKI